MNWAGHTLAPVVPLQEAVDGAVMDGVTKLGFKGLLDLVGGSNLALGGTVEERGKKGLFLGEREVLIAASTFARCIESSGSEAVVGGDDDMDSGNGDTTVERDAPGEAGLNKSVVDNGPATTLGLVGSREHPSLDSLEWEVGSSTRHPAHTISKYQGQTEPNYWIIHWSANSYEPD